MPVTCRRKRYGLRVTPEPPWVFTFDPPDDMLHPRYTGDFEPFAIGGNTPDRRTVLYADTNPLVLTYTRREENTTLWESDLFIAVAMTLSTFIASALSGRFEWYEKARTQAQEAVARAQIVARDIEQSRAQTEVSVDYPGAPWIAGRTGYGGPSLANNLNYVSPVQEYPRPFHHRANSNRVRH